MNEISMNAQDQIQRLLEVGAQWMGLQRTSGVVLATLYMHECTNQEYLSVKRLSELTNLSTSTISSICSQLESLGIIVGQSDGSSRKRGRRKVVFALRMNLQDLLYQGIRNYINHVRRILHDIEVIRDEARLNDSDSQMTIDRMVFEISQFLDESTIS